MSIIIAYSLVPVKCGFQGLPAYHETPNGSKTRKPLQAAKFNRFRMNRVGL